MVRKIIALIVLVPLAIILVLFAVANRQVVTLSFDPFGGDPPLFAVTAPLFIIVFLALALGVIVGGAAAWIRQSRWRRAARQHEAELRRLVEMADAERARREPPGYPIPLDAAR